jgi:TatD DNase family protein
MLFDAHNHLQFAEFAPFLDQITTDLAEINYGGAVVNGTHPDDDWDAVTALAARFDWVVPSYGIHPWDAGIRPSSWQSTFTTTLQAHPRAAVGEIGLDTLILDPSRRDRLGLAGTRIAPIDEQMEVFAWQLRWAAENNRPASVHCVRAWHPLLEVLRQTPILQSGFLLHAYGGSVEMIKPLSDLGAYFSFNTAHIDPRKTRQRAAFRAVPTDRLLVETDAPATPPLAPTYTLPNTPDGASLNHPANLAAAYKDLARLREIPLPDLESIVAHNFKRLFKSE